jgi:ferric-dicitrate binding protein FerR (iron transport regulator)
MESSKDQLSYLWQQYAANRATPEELDKLFDLLNDPAQDEEHFQLFREALSKVKQTEHLSSSSQAAMWDHIMQSESVSAKIVAIRPPRWNTAILRWWAAASVVVVLATGIYLWNRPSPIGKPITRVTVLPGKEGAILTLADGSQVAIDSAGTGIIAKQGGAAAKLVNGTLVYEADGKEVVFNKMTTPKGRQFKLTLPDGSMVWLNAESSIRYPTVFAGNERAVDITGEAYLQVTPNASMPFRVRAGNRTTIEVLGTEFNINAYQNEPAIKTTLISGAVRVKENSQEITLQPGQQVLQSNGQLQLIKQVNTGQVVAWKNGFFNFENVPLVELMHQLERWYDITVEYENGIPDITFGGKMSRQESLESLLKGLEESGVHFRLEGRKVIVMNKQ